MDVTGSENEPQIVRVLITRGKHGLLSFAIGQLVDNDFSGEYDEAIRSFSSMTRVEVEKLEPQRYVHTTILQLFCTRLHPLLY